ncbi:Maf family protein [Jeotgalibacillus aurantiacus]|uniref:Maf family protein n=1 Tax=Jeotgalibacillus aurantiacus TaxID=2763266 RepID=UPI001D0A9971|nr:Maf family protein [Jeotgalibacillus aurantiacus]
MKSMIILASQSPRRKELMQHLNLPFTVIPSSFDESSVLEASPKQTVETLAEEKARAVAANYPEHIVIGCDTVVYDQKILGKPADQNQAREMLRSLSGNTHTVYTGVSIHKGSNVKTFTEAVDVTFWPLSDQEIEDYILTSDPYDKAGAYGIQTGGSLFVKKIDGDYYAVVGLPISRLKRELKPFLD